MPLSRPALRPWLTGLALCLGAAAQATDTPAAPPLQASEDGSTVIDQRSKLAWSRCVHGMQWNGTTCTGQPLLLDRAQAAALASTRAKTEGVRWRLPRANELRRLVDKQAHPPGLPPQLFPGAPRTWHWSGTANIKHFAANQYNYNNISQGRTGDDSSQLSAFDGWAVDLATGEARGDIARGSKLPVRLVRPLD